MTVQPLRNRRLPLLGAAALLVVLQACSSGTAATQAPAGDGSSSPVSTTSAAKIRSNLAGSKDVDLEKKVKVTVASGTLSEVVVTDPQGGKVEGRLSADKTRWVSTGTLRADSRYRVRGVAKDDAGLQKTHSSSFRTRALSLDEQTYASFVPLDGQTVGVGMPVIMRFDIPITDRASIERHLSVTSRPAQVGAFHWMSSQEVHWRPRTYWQPGTKVSVKADIGGVPAGNGIYGQEDREINFQVGRSMVSKVDMNTHQMRVFRDGKLMRTIPITTGEQPKFTTRSGIKVIVEKFRHKRMNSETIGIDPSSADGYDLDDVEYAMRVTYSGEFVHAAPWSEGSQGRANVSHGCTGMSTANAGWLYDNSIVGDVIEYVGTDRGTSLDNGFGDWNTSFADYKAGSALS